MQPQRNQNRLSQGYFQNAGVKNFADLSSTKHLTEKNHFLKKSLKVSQNCLKGLKQMEKHSFKKNC